MSEKVLSWQEIAATNDVEYTKVRSYGGQLVRLGSLSSLDIIQWIEDNNDKDKRREAGLRLIVKSFVDEDGKRVPEDKQDEFLASLRGKDARSNGRVVEAILRLNGLTTALPKNVWSEEATGGSPTSSPSPQGT